MKFLKYVFASALGSILAGVFLLILFFALIMGSITAAIDDFASDNSISISSNSVLTMRFEEPIVERGQEEDLVIPGFSEKQIGLNQIVDNIAKAKSDSKIEGIFLNMSDVSAGLASVETIRNSLMDFKTSGKWIIAYSEYYSQSAYYLATTADEIYLNPKGGIAFQGIDYQPMFMKDMFTKIGVEMQIVRGKNNKFKSAVEPFMYNSMSEANKVQSSKLIFSIWDHVVNEVAAARGITNSEVNDVADDLLGMFPESVLEADFIDGLLYQDQIYSLLSDKLGVSSLDNDQLVKLSTYKRTKGRSSGIANYKKKKIAVIYAVGNIISGEGDDQTIGSDRISNAIYKARNDSSIKAIVLRVNSPGGSALASDVIWRETKLASEQKPLVISMGDYAASGGYYISVEGDRIFAEPNTITGSIGVFGVVPNAKELLNDKVGVHFDGVKTNTHSDIMGIANPLSQSEYAIIQKSIDNVYDTFTSKVAEGRDLRQSYVDSIGQGRVWTGIDAIENGLVDEIGGLNDAIEYAARMAGVENYRIKSLPKQKSPFEELLEEFGMQASQKLIEAKLVNYELVEQYQYIQSVMKMEGIQAILPIRISF